MKIFSEVGLLLKRLLGLCCIVIGLLIAWVSYGQPIPWHWGTGSTEYSLTVSDSIELPLDETTSVELNVSSTKVLVSGGDVEQLELFLETVEGSSTKMDITQRGEQIKVNVKRQAGTILGLWNLLQGNEWAAETLHVTVPYHYEQRLRIDGSSGNVQISSIEGLSMLDINMSSGQMQIEQVATDIFRYNGSSGRLNINGLTATESNIKISSGTVHIEELTGTIRGRSSSGAVRIETNRLSAPIDWQASSGSITLLLPADASFRLDASASYCA